MNKLSLLVPAVASLAVFAQSPTPSGPLAKDQGETRASGRIEVKSPAMKAGAEIPSKYSAYADDVSPPLQWSRVADAKSYALIVEDPDANSTRPFVHWSAWNIPAATAGLPEGVKEAPYGARQGKNGQGASGYFGPKPPAGDPDHHYHFQVFALDTTLDVPADADRDQLVEAMKGHVLAKGELVALYKPPKG